MAVRGGFPILSTQDLERLVSFYESAFDAERTYGYPGPDGNDVFVSLRVGGATVAIAADEVPTAAADRIALWFYVDDADSAYEQALRAGGQAVRGPADMPWGERVASIKDPDGFLISMGAEKRSSQHR
ncbi:VOC family protein [Arthrobacter zhaoguopingii]|uniref:VOC family protein n=1 Tax=Arthrobacter zhaoguopingii TaxID=2681491 RepID=UPI0013584833|nr:VOC family protein [Arthrobacter zhaoguopingii]